jgi:hypothetical protein
MMNFAEGIKRIYIAFSCLLFVAGIAVSVSDIPSERHIGYEYHSKLKSAITSDVNRLENTNQSEYDFKWSDKFGIDFVSYYCGSIGDKFTAAKSVCKDKDEAIADLPWSKARYVAKSFGYGLIFIISSTLLWMALAWIGRGFKK